MQIHVFHNRTDSTVTVWFGDPRDEYVCEETGDEMILMKDETGQVTGFEKLNFSVTDSKSVRSSFERS